MGLDHRCIIIGLSPLWSESDIGHWWGGLEMFCFLLEGDSSIDEIEM